MKRSSRFTGLILALLGTMVLLNNLSRPRVEALHGSDIVRLIACGFCFGVAFIGLIGKLKVRDDS